VHAFKKEINKNLRVNHEIRARELRVISATGEQLGVMALAVALALAEEQGLDLIEIVPTAAPPVAKIMDYGKFRYDQTKREKENKKAQHQVKVKEVKLSPNISEHDLDVKLRQAREFLEKGNKVKITIMFRGREMMHPELGKRLLDKINSTLEEVSSVETPAKMFGRILNMVLAPGAKKKK
jgi:translation initiation factor IF-3